MTTLPSCFQLLNTDYFNNLLLQIGNVNSPEELQTIANEIMSELSLLESTITSQKAFLEPILALLTAPGANLSEIVTWITNLINNFLTPIYKPYTTYVSQLAALPAQISALVTAIESAALKFPNVTITIPTVSIFCSL